MSEVGELDKAGIFCIGFRFILEVHIWEYDGYSAYDGLRSKLASDAVGFRLTHQLR